MLPSSLSGFGPPRGEHVSFLINDSDSVIYQKIFFSLSGGIFFTTGVDRLDQDDG